jgi:CubicO group peptidase (beta-lactamase class C family)
MADPVQGRPWERGTLAVILSGTKGLVAVCVHMLVDRGQLDIDAPVARYWPEFGAAGKERVSVRDVLTHRSRVPGVHAPLVLSDLLDDQRAATLLASQEQERTDRAAFCYHALTFGWLCGELVRRIDGRSVGEFFAAEVAGPLGLEAWIGLPESFQSRVARMFVGPGCGESPTWDPAAYPDDELLQTVWANPPIFREPLVWNGPETHRAEIPAVGAVASARALARLYGCLACGGAIDGVRLLAPEAINRASERQVEGQEPLVGRPMAFGLGFHVQTDRRQFGPPPIAFGHPGAGGSVHAAWPDERVGFSYTMNEMRDSDDDARAQSLLVALHETVCERER